MHPRKTQVKSVRDVLAQRNKGQDRFRKEHPEDNFRDEAGRLLEAPQGPEGDREPASLRTDPQRNIFRARSCCCIHQDLQFRESRCSGGPAGSVVQQFALRSVQREYYKGCRRIHARARWPRGQGLRRRQEDIRCDAQGYSLRRGGSERNARAPCLSPFFRSGNASDKRLPLRGVFTRRVDLQQFRVFFRAEGHG